MTNTNGFRLAIPKTEELPAELWIYDEIGPMSGITAQAVASALKQVASDRQLKIRLNSPGGSAFDGIAIYNLLQQRGRVVVDIDGMALSAASLVAMAGDEIRMAENAMLMIHDPWTLTIGDAKDHQDAAERLEKLAGTLVSTYAARTGQSEKAVAEMMTAETWMTAGEALEFGFATSVMPNKTKPKPKNEARTAIRLAYRHAPVERLAELGFSLEPAEPAELAARGESQPPVVENADAFSPDGTVRSSIQASRLIASKLEAGESLTPAERALAASWARAAEATARAENDKHINTRSRLGDCL